MSDDGPSPRARLRVTVVDAAGRRVRGSGLDRWLSQVAPRAARGDVTVALVSDHRIRALNRAYRDIDRSTDVLSFPAGTPPGAGPSPARGRSGLPRSGHPLHLGDIVIARGVARRQARGAGHGERTEWRVLALHGLLHLLGYDHDTDDGSMRRLERKLRRAGGLRESLTEREARS